MIRNKYTVEFTINIYEASLQILKDCLTELGDDLSLEEENQVNGKGKIVKVRIRTDEPHLVFDACSEFGRLKSVKVQEA